MGDKKKAGKAGENEKDKQGLNQPNVDNTTIPPTGEDEAARAATQGRPNEDSPNQDRADEDRADEGSSDENLPNEDHPNEDHPNEDSSGEGSSDEKPSSQGGTEDKGSDDTAKNKVDKDSDADKKVVKKPSVTMMKAVETAKTIIEMMDSNKVSTLFENSHGEYFTTDNLAHLSEKGNKDKVKCHRRETLEIIINSVA